VIPGMKRRVVQVTAVLAAAVAVLVAVSLPPSPAALVEGEGDGTIAGVLHVHSNRSDGRSSPDEIVAIAARAGLKFIVFTDHGDATRQPDPPRYLAGVLCLDGVEISTTGGHYVVFDMPASPYPLGGEPRDVIEDVHRLDGFGVAAHPDSPKPELRWREWTAPFDGMEIVNPDTSWRVHLLEPEWRPKLRLVQALLAYPIRPAAAIASLIDESPNVLPRWDAITPRRRVVGLAGVDAHAKLALKEVDPGDNRYSIALPSYEASFRTLSVHVRPERPLSGDAAADARAVFAAIRAGHLYMALDGLASPPSFTFTASNQRGSAQAGDQLAAGGPVMLRVRSNAPAAFDTVVMQGSRILTSRNREPDFTFAAPAEPAVYRVAIRAIDRPRQPTWIVSNPIYVRGPEARLPAARRPATATRPLFEGTTGDTWRFETAPTSLAALDVVLTPAAPELRLRYGLAGGTRGGQFAALAVNTPGGLAAFDRLAFTARAEHPMRISVQIRVAVKPSEDERWQRSVYIDTTDGERTIYFDDFTPIGDTRTYGPPLANVHSIVFVIDMTNTKPGTSGRLWIKNVSLQR
jgi:hypothetical protein